MDDYRQTIRVSALRLQELNAKIKKTFKIQRHGEAHHAACSVFHAEYKGLAFPSGLDTAMQKLKAADPKTVETAIQFLEVAPRFHRSGYIAEDILRHLKHVQLTVQQRDRLVPIILDSLVAGGRRQFHCCAKLAGKLQVDRILMEAIGLLKSENAEIRRRAGATIEIMRNWKAKPPRKSMIRLSRL